MSPPLNGLYSELILASTSPARVTLLKTLGLPFRSEAPGVEENVSSKLNTSAMVAHLAERKARAVLARFPNALVVGADQLVDVDGHPLGKPADDKAAHQQLQSLSGRTHQIFTGVCVIGPGYFACEVDACTMEMFALAADEIARYVKLGEWQGCAGGYRVEGRGAALFQSIEGDKTSVQGLPLTRLVRLLREANVSFFHL